MKSKRLLYYKQKQLQQKLSWCWCDGGISDDKPEHLFSEKEAIQAEASISGGEQASQAPLRQALKLQYSPLSPPPPEQRKALKRIFAQTFSPRPGQRGAPVHGTSTAKTESGAALTAPPPQSVLSSIQTRKGMEKRGDFAFFSERENGPTLEVRLPLFPRDSSCHFSAPSTTPHLKKGGTSTDQFHSWIGGDRKHGLVGLAEDVRCLLKGVSLSVTSASSRNLRSNVYPLHLTGSGVGAEAFRSLLFSGFIVLEREVPSSRKNGFAREGEVDHTLGQTVPSRPRAPLPGEAPTLSDKEVEQVWGKGSGKGKGVGIRSGQIFSSAHPSKLPQWIQAQNWESSFQAKQLPGPRESGGQGLEQEKQFSAQAEAVGQTRIPLSSRLTPALCMNCHQQVRTVCLLSVRSIFVCLL